MGIDSTVLFAVTLLGVFCCITGLGNMTVLYEWKEICFAYPTPEAESYDIKRGAYIPGASYILDVDVYYPPRHNGYSGANASPIVFVTTPRFINGIPASLSVVSTKQYKGSNLLEPYPSWSWHVNTAKCSKDRLISVYKIKIDRCGRLWVLDDGKIANHRVCPPQIIAFDLNKNSVVYQYQFPEKQYIPKSYFADFVVDVRESCNECPFAYIADAVANSLIVWNGEISWEIQDSSMYPIPDDRKVKVKGEYFESMFGIGSMAITPYSPHEDRVVYFQPFNSRRLTWVSTSFLRNYTALRNKYCVPEIQNFYDNFCTSYKPSNSLTVSQDIDKNGILYYALLEECSLGCYNTKRGEIGKDSCSDIIFTNTVLLDFIAGLKVVSNTKENCQELWTVTNTFQNVINCIIDRRKVNFRILVGNIEALTAGKRCYPV